MVHDQCVVSRNQTNTFGNPVGAGDLKPERGSCRSAYRAVVSGPHADFATLEGSLTVMARELLKAKGSGLGLV